MRHRPYCSAAPPPRPSASLAGLLLVGEAHDPLREGVALGVDLLVADERREHVAGHQEREVQVARVPDGRDEIGVVPVVDRLLALDEAPFLEFVDDTTPLPGVDVEFLPEVALVDSAGLPDQL